MSGTLSQSMDSRNRSRENSVERDCWRGFVFFLNSNLTPPTGLAMELIDHLGPSPERYLSCLGMLRITRPQNRKGATILYTDKLVIARYPGLSTSRSVGSESSHI
ncbi:hypothetical protein AB1N83_012121 [Pleurotus pulmonarius]